MSKASRTILLIEDSPEDRALIRRLLEADPNYRYELREAVNGAQGLQLWREQPPDCVLLDYQLPDIDGLALLKTMVAEYQSFTCPVVMLTGLAAPELAVAALNGGAQDFIVKERTPPGQLHHAINSAIEKVAAQLELVAQRQQLAESEAKFSAAFHKSSACMCIVSEAEVAYIDINQTTCDLFGVKREDMIGRSPADFNFYADPAQRVALRELLNRDGYVHDFEVKWQIKSGEVRTHLLNADRLTINGQPCLFVVSNDITERNWAEEKLRENQHFTQSLIDTAPSVLYIFDLKTNTTKYLSEQAARVLGFSSDEVKDTMANFLERNMHPEDARAIEKYFQKIIQSNNGDAFEFEYRMRHKSGEWRWFRSRDRVFKRDENGRAEEILGIAHDITERKQAQNELRENEARFRRVLAQSSAGIVQTDAAGRMTLVNERWCEMLGYSEAELLSMSVLDITHSSSQQVTLDNVTKLAEGGPDFEVEKNYQRKDGSLMHAFSKVSALRGKDGEYQGIVAVVMDISARIKLEQNLAFLAEVSKDLVQLTNIDEMMSSLCAKIGVYFNVARVIFAEIAEDETTSVIRHEWRQDGLPTLREAAELKNLLTSKLPSAQRDGDIAYITDVAAELRDAALTLTALGIAALLGAPIVRDEKLHLYLGILHSEPRVWRADEIELLRELTARIRTRLERARVEKDLRISEERFRRLFESAKDGILILNPDTAQIIDANPYIAGLLGFSHTELIGKELWEIGLFEDIEKSKAAVLELQEKKYIRYEDLPLETKSGRRANVEFVSNVYAEGDGTVIQCNIRDITERKVVEKRLRDEEERFRLLTENAKDYAMVFIDNEMRITHWNIGAERILGWMENEIIGQSAAVIFTPEDRENKIPEKEISIAKETGHARDERWHLRKDESRFYGFGEMIALRDEAGNLRGFAKLFRDLTEKKQAENQLRESEERFRTLFDSIDEGFCIIEMIFDEANKPVDYRFIQANPAMERLTGLKDAIGKTISEMVPDLEAYWFEFYGNVALTGEAARVESKAAAMNRWFEIYASRIGDTASRRVAVVFNNITERKEIETRREQLLQEEQRARETAEAATRAKDEFLAVVSHELRNPLNAMLGYARLMRANPHDATQIANYAEVVERNARMQQQLIEDLLDTARIISGKLKIETAPTDLRLVLADALAVVRPAAEAKQIELHASLGDEPQTLTGDAARLQQVAWNLLQNAIKFTPAQGRVELRLERTNDAKTSDDHLCFIVSDTGKGIEPEFQSAIFDRFTQQDMSSTRRHGGLGLGLTLAKQLVELHGGVISVTSPGRDQGSTFTVTLPRQPSLPAASAPVLSVSDTAAMNSFNGGARLDGLRLLVVDDQEEARHLLAHTLREWGALVTAAESGFAALSLLEQQSFDALICDIAMPDMDGYEVLRRLRAQNRTAPRLPAIALTANSRPQDRLRALAAGFQMHVAKPVEPEELIAVIASLAGRL